MASEYLKWKARDEKPRETRPLTPQEKRRNWWDYHKWHVVIALFLLAAAVSITRSVLHIGQTLPDVEVAYVGTTLLPDDTVSALETALAAHTMDANGDGTTYVQVHQYLETDDTSSQAYWAMLVADMEACDSFLFIMESPETFQEKYALLSRLDGGEPDAGQRSFEDCYLRLGDCPTFVAMELGDYTTDILGETVHGSNWSLLENLYIGRRGFYADRNVAHPEAAQMLWDQLREGAVSP